MDLGKSIEDSVLRNMSNFAYLIMPKLLYDIDGKIKRYAHLIYDDGVWF